MNKGIAENNLPIANDIYELFIGELRSGHSQRSYAQGLHKFGKFLKGRDIVDLASVTPNDIKAFKLSLESTLSPKTASMTLGHVKSLYAFLNNYTVKGDDGRQVTFLSHNPTELVKCTSVDSREQKTEVLTMKEAKRLLEAAYNVDGDDIFRASLKIQVLLMLHAGLRCEEVATLRMSNLKLQNDRLVITVNGKGNRYRFISLSKVVTGVLMPLFDELKLTQDDYVIRPTVSGVRKDSEGHIDTSSIFRRIKSLAKRAKIKTAISPHSLRRTCATLMYKQKAPIEVIQRFLGHENVATTHRYIEMEMDIEMTAEHALDFTTEGEAV